METLPLFDESKKSNIFVSLIVPAYNEEERLPVMLDETIEHLEKKSKEDHRFRDGVEIVIIDDGSRDKTLEVAIEYSKRKYKFKLEIIAVKLLRNSGKGAAVKAGMLRGRGQYLLMVDADGATKFSDFDKVFSKMESIEQGGNGVVVGSRNQLKEGDVVQQRKALRKLISLMGNLLIRSVVGGRIKDTQCGFKLFSRKAAARIFPIQHLERWSFDIELLHLASALQIPAYEVPVNWHEVPGSKLNVLTATIQFARDLVLIKLLYVMGLWKYSDYLC